MSNDRVSRKQRLRAFGNKKAGIALGLLFILLFLAVGKTYRTQMENLLHGTFPDRLFHDRIAGDTDSLVIHAGDSFLLNYPARVDTVLQDISGSRHIRVIQPWPRKLPLLIYAERLRALSHRLEMTCSCAAYGNDDSLNCRLIAGNSKRIDIAVVPDSKTKLSGKSVAVILKNLYDLENQDIIEIIDSRLPFGYMATADVFPAGDIKKRLQAKWVASILNIPASRGKLIQYSSQKGKDKSGQVQSREIDYNALASDLFGRHPNPTSFKFERSADIDYMFVEAVIRQALEKKAGYIYDRKNAPDKIDSLAYSSGLSIVTYEKMIDYTKSSFNEIRLSLFNCLLQADLPQNTLIEVDISKTKAEDLIELMGFLEEIGINTLNINKLTDHPEFFAEDL